MSKVNQLKSGAILSYAQMVVNILVGLLYTPLMLRLLGRAEYGLYNTVASTISMLSVLSLGFNSSYIRYYAQYRARDDEHAIQSLNGVFLIIFSAIGMLALLCGLYLSFHLKLVFDQGLTAAEYETARVLMLMLTANLALSFPMSTFTSIISAHERYVFLKSMGILKTVLSPLLALPLLLMGYRSVALVSVTVAISLLTDVFYLAYARKRLRVRFRFRGFEKGLIRSLFLYSAFIALHIVVDQINNNMDKFLLGRFVGTGEVAVYAVGFALYHYYMFFSLGVSSVFSPRIHRIVNATRENMEKQKEELTALFVKIGRIQFLLLGLVSSGLIFFGKEFIAFWAGDGYQNSYWVAILLIVPSTIPLIQNIGIEVQRALNRHPFGVTCYFFMAIANLIVSIDLCQRFGAIGSAMGTAMSYVLANGIIINIYYHKRCNLDILVFWKNILRVSLGLVPPIMAGCAIKNIWDFNTIPAFLTGILTYTVVYCVSMWLIGMNTYEKKMIFGRIDNIRKKYLKNPWPRRT